MKKILIVIVIFLSASNNVLFSQELKINGMTKIQANPDKGFYWSYLIFIPDTSLIEENHLKIFVIPNNTGKTSDSIEVHERDATQTISRGIMVSEKLKTAVLVPVFPRSKKDWKIYTHALDRDVMLTENDSLKRLDLQLLAMIDDAREKLLKINLTADEKILMLGFSASGMFVNRFAFLHPERVSAAAIGSPGGWPIVPIEKYNGYDLNYPAGINDFEKISGKKFDKDKFSKIKIYFFLGDEDENDSVVFDDGYDEEERKAVVENFGNSLRERWKIAEDIYEKNNFTNSRFVIYPGVGHIVNKEIINDLFNFFNEAIN